MGISHPVDPNFVEVRNKDSEAVPKIVPPYRIKYFCFLDESAPFIDKTTMAHLNSGSSIYHEIQALYWRGLDGKLLAVEGKRARGVEEAWAQMWEEIKSRPHDRKQLTLPSGGQMESLQLRLSSFAKEWADNPKLLSVERSNDVVFSIRELRRPCEDRIIGILSMVPASAQAAVDFRNWASLFILLETRFQPLRRLKDGTTDNAKARESARRIREVFEQKLQNSSPNDQWISGGGRDYFEDRVFGFTERQSRVDFCIPAFPCKSSHPGKTNGIYPDRAEMIALDVLRSFTQSVGEIYEPGGKIWIISDGHVFSDCSELLLSFWLLMHPGPIHIS